MAEMDKVKKVKLQVGSKKLTIVGDSSILEKVLSTILRELLVEDKYDEGLLEKQTGMEHNYGVVLWETLKLLSNSPVKSREIRRYLNSQGLEPNIHYVLEKGYATRRDGMYYITELGKKRLKLFEKGMLRYVRR